MAFAVGPVAASSEVELESVLGWLKVQDDLKRRTKQADGGSDESEGEKGGNGGMYGGMGGLGGILLGLPPRDVTAVVGGLAARRRRGVRHPSPVPSRSSPVDSL